MDYVNGMQATVEKYTARAGGLQVKTRTGHRFVVWPWTDSEHGGITYYPVRPGYAGPIMKFQGSELAHVTVYLDYANVPAAGYTALSRVSGGDKYLLGGMMARDHFTPAQ
eukprot:4693233-Prorocentrum_lima.AAC.1